MVWAQCVGLKKDTFFFGRRSLITCFEIYWACFHGSNWQKMVPRRFLLLCGLKKGAHPPNNKNHRVLDHQLTLEISRGKKGRIPCLDACIIHVSCAQNDSQ